MLKNNPSVTVIIPSYKRPGLLLKTLKAVYKQKGGYNISVIVVDDYSPEPLRPIIKKDFPKTKIIRNSTNLRSGPSRNQALKFINSDYVAFLDADDLWFPTFLNQSIKAITDYGSIGSISLSKPLLSPGLSTKFIIKIKLLSLIRDCLQSLFYVFNRQQMPQSSFYLCQVSHLLFKSGVIKDLKFDTAYNFGGEDWKYVLEAMDRGFITIIPKRLVKYRYHPQSSIQNPINQKNKWRSYQQLFKELKRRTVNDFMTKLFGYYVKSFSK